MAHVALLTIMGMREFDSVELAKEMKCNRDYLRNQINKIIRKKMFDDMVTIRIQKQPYNQPDKLIFHFNFKLRQKL
jgi:hypothetical protein